MMKIYSCIRVCIQIIELEKISAEAEIHQIKGQSTLMAAHVHEPFPYYMCTSFHMSDCVHAKWSLLGFHKYAHRSLHARAHMHVYAQTMK